MADPITLAVVGAGVGALMNPNDPLKGAVLGGAAGFTGGTALGAGAAGGAAAGTTVGAGGIGGAAGGTGLTATTLGGAVPASAGLGTASGGVGLTAGGFAPSAAGYGAISSATPAAAGMGGGAGLLGTAGTGASASAPFATAAGAPTMLATNPLSNLLGGKTSDQLSIAQKLAGGGQRGQNAPPIQARPATGMKLPVNQSLNYNAPLLALLQESARKEERPMFSLL